MKSVMVIVSLLTLTLMSCAASGAPDDQQEIRALTDQFCKSIVAKNLDAIDKIFDADPSNVYYDINEGPLVGMARLKQVWRAAITNNTISKFSFLPDMQISVNGDHALQTGKWEQQIDGRGSSRQIVGRATILWKKSSGGWRVYHYHASITPGGR